MGALKLTYRSENPTLKVVWNSLKDKENSCTGAYGFGFNGMEKDDEIFNASGTSYTAEFWQYDSRIGRRWNLDPKPNPSISQYATFACNPIWYSDPLGDTIKIKGGQEYKDIVNFALDKIKSTESGMKLYEDLQKSEFIFNIEEGSNGFKADKGPGGGYLVLDASGNLIQEGFGSGGTIFWDPTSLEGGLNTEGSRERPAYIGLAHEMAHGEDASQGKMDPFQKNPMNGLKNSENYATHYENKIRSEAGIPLRTHYGIRRTVRGNTVISTVGTKQIIYKTFRYIDPTYNYAKENPRMTTPIEMNPSGPRVN